MPPALLRRVQRFIDLNRERILRYWSNKIDAFGLENAWAPRCGRVAGHPGGYLDRQSPPAVLAVDGSA
jgi:hypothetical protein